MNYKAILNMYSVECAVCFAPFTMTYHQYHYRTEYELCRKCTKKHEVTS